MNIVTKFNPSHGAQFARWHNDEDVSYEQQPVYGELQDAVSEGSVQDVLDLIKRYPEMDDDIRWRAYFKAREERDPELARKIANEVRQPESKQRMIADLDREQTSTPVNGDNLVELEKYVDQIKQSEEKV